MNVNESIENLVWRIQQDTKSPEFLSIRDFVGWVNELYEDRLRLANECERLRKRLGENEQ